MIYRKYECKNRKSVYEFWNDRKSKTITVKFTSESGESEIIVKEVFNHWKESDNFFTQVINDKTEDGLFTNDLLKKTKENLNYLDEYDDLLNFDLSLIGLIDDNGSLDLELENIKETKTPLGIISDGFNVLRFLQWAIMFNTIQNGLIASMESPEFKKFSKKNKKLLVTANEHGQLTSIIAQINGSKSIVPIEADDIYIDRSTDIYHNLEVLFLNGQTAFPVKILSSIVNENKIFKQHSDYLIQLDLEKITNEIRDQFIAYYDEDIYFEIINFEWYSGNHGERHAYSYCYTSE